LGPPKEGSFTFFTFTFFARSKIMKIGILSDTHEVKGNDLQRVMDAFKNAGVELIFHCGDIYPGDLDPKKFLGIPVICALVDTQPDEPEFKVPPKGWTFTVTKSESGTESRIVRIKGDPYYVGHKRSFRLLNSTETEFLQNLDELRRDTDGLREICSGHLHFQLFDQTGLVNFINPGAVTGSLSGRIEYAILDTENNEISFCQMYKTEPIIENSIIGVISDSLRISQIDTNFWERLAKELEKRKVTDVIHCGNIAIPDIGRPELSQFQVHYNLRDDQKKKISKDMKIPDNWHLVGNNEAKELVVEINGYRFCVQLDLGITITDKSAVQIGSVRQELKRQYNELDFILCGFTHNCLLMGGYQPYIINPGDIIDDRNFATIEFGKKILITFCHVPLPEITAE
jgi:putative phosphoesterase